METSGRVGNTNARFWTRPDIKRAMMALDVWANQKWHSERMPYRRHEVRVVATHGGRTVELRSVPVGEITSISGDERALTMEAVTGRPKTGARGSRDLRTSVDALRPDGYLHIAKELTVMVDMIIGKDSVLRGLILWLYPKHGVYHYDERSKLAIEIGGADPVEMSVQSASHVARHYSNYRPDVWTMNALATYEGRNPGRYLDGLLKRMERDLLSRVADQLRDFGAGEWQDVKRAGAALSARIQHNCAMADRLEEMQQLNSRKAVKRVALADQHEAKNGGG